MQSWSPESTAHFRRLHATGKLSAQQIADELNKLGYAHITRSACIGKARRMHLVNGREPGLSWRNQHSDGVVKKPKPPKPIVRLEPAPPIARGERTGLLVDLDAEQCRFPVAGDPHKGRPYLFCTDNKLPHSPYCARHHRLSFTPAHGRLH